MNTYGSIYMVVKTIITMSVMLLFTYHALRLNSHGVITVL
jgi:hypothetical protein